MKHLFDCAVFLAAMTVAGAEFVPEPKPERIVFAATGARYAQTTSGDFEADTKKVKQFWDQEFAAILPDRPDLIVTAEMCDEPVMPPEKKLEYFRVRGNRIRDFFADTAKRNNCYILYAHSRLTPDGKGFFNSAELIGRDGKTVGIYDKNFLVIGESKNGARYGTEAPVFDTDFGRVAAAICFDLNFDELFVRYREKGVRLLLFPSMFHGGPLQLKRSLENEAYLIGAIAHSKCGMVDALGVARMRAGNYFNRVCGSINLDYEVVHYDYNWEKLAALKAKYGRGVTVTDPGDLGRVLVTSELKDIKAKEMLREFDIRNADDYWKQSKEYRENKLKENTK